MPTWNADIEWRPSSPLTADQIDHVMGALIAHDLGPTLSDRLNDHVGAVITVEAPTLREAIDASLAAVEAATGEEAVEIHVLPTEDAENRVALPYIPDLVGYADIAEMAGVSRQRARQLADTRGFPPAVVQTQAGPLRFRSHVEKWLAGWERTPGRPRKTPH